MIVWLTPMTVGVKRHEPVPLASVIVQLPPAPVTLTVPLGVPPLSLTLTTTVLFCPRWIGPVALTLTVVEPELIA